MSDLLFIILGAVLTLILIRLFKRKRFGYLYIDKSNSECDIYTASINGDLESLKNKDIVTLEVKYTNSRNEHLL